MIRNWKTSVLGALALASTVIPNINRLRDLINPVTIGTIFAGVAALFAKDHDVTGGPRVQ